MFVVDLSENKNLKITYKVNRNQVFMKLKMHQKAFGGRTAFAPLVELTALPDLLAGFWGRVPGKGRD